MYSFLLKRALPFTLTFVFGAALGGLVGLFGPSEKKSEYVLSTRTYEFGGRCRSVRPRNLVAESRPLNILRVPDAVLVGAEDLKGYTEPVKVRVTFGADGKVQGLEPVASWCGNARASGQDSLPPSVWEAVGHAARQIEFQPETINGMPVTVTREVKIGFATSFEN
jgi:hypothetical protein